MTSDPPAEMRTPAWATPLGTAIIVLLLMLPRLAFAVKFGLIGDEAYYAIWSFHPAFNYFDHSPSVAWIIWLGRMLFGERLSPLRTLGILLIAGGVAVVGLA